MGAETVRTQDLEAVAPTFFGSGGATLRIKAMNKCKRADLDGELVSSSLPIQTAAHPCELRLDMHHDDEDDVDANEDAACPSLVMQVHLVTHYHTPWHYVPVRIEHTQGLGAQSGADHIHASRSKAKTGRE
ncbi:hypothetical protein N9L68_09225 [bacterium]|nr:hypothetical protein [bacterium]